MRPALPPVQKHSKGDPPAAAAVASQRQQRLWPSAAGRGGGKGEQQAHALGAGREHSAGLAQQAAGVDTTGWLRAAGGQAG